MSLGRTSIQQPVLAIVLSIVVVLVGGIAYLTLPVAEYPNIVPPTVIIQANYPGASAETVASTVATPIEQEVNGVEQMIYMSSQATSDGGLEIVVTFKPGTDLDKAQVLVQNRVSLATPRLPEQVQRTGVTVKKSSPTQFCSIFLYSPDGTYDQLYVSNYFSRRVADVLKRLQGVGDLQYFGAREYSMRVWLDPEKTASFGLAPRDVIEAIRAQNTQVAGGIIGQPPITTQSFQPSLIFDGRLREPSEFESIVVKTNAEGQAVRLKDVARIEYGALTYSTDSYLNRQPAVAVQVLRLPGANALATLAEIEKTMKNLGKEFPKGLAYNIAYNPTAFIGDSIGELVKTIYEAIVLVVFVVLIFLQGWRAAIIPILAIPVSLIGTFALMAPLGLAINNLTLFALVLSVGIVVDDAIVVVENVERHLSEGASPLNAAFKTMEEVGQALFSITLVLCAVFIPTIFLSGITGQFFREFGITIALSTAISCFNSFTLSPALASLILKPHTQGRFSHRKGGLLRPFKRVLLAAAHGFNLLFDRISQLYRALVLRLPKATFGMLAVYATLIGIGVYLLTTTPQGFIPTQDRGYLVVLTKLPSGSSLERTTTIARQVVEIANTVPGVARVASFSGFSGDTRTLSSNDAGVFPILKPFSERTKEGYTADKIAEDLRKRLGKITGASFIVVSPAPVEGIGNTGGFAMRLEDRAGLGQEILAKSTRDLVAAANATPGLTRVYSPYSATTPQIKVDLNRTKAEMLGVSSSSINEAIEFYMGSSYINDFNMLGRTYRVTAQADMPFRMVPEDLARLKVRNRDGQMVPLGNVTGVREQFGPDRVPRYNLYQSTEISGDTLPGKGAAFAVTAMEELARKVLPPGIAFEWTDLTYQQTTAANTGLLVFPLCVLFVYLVLAAQYGNWSLPISILLIVPMCLLSATLGVRFMGQDINILTQIGFVVLVGLAAKNAILIVEFARQLEIEGKGRIDAIGEACRIRLRPIVMTSLAFILGVLPLVLSHGAGAEMRQAVGAAVFFGMIGVTIFGLVFTPVFYLVVRNAVDRHARPASAV